MKKYHAFYCFPETPNSLSLIHWCHRFQCSVPSTSWDFHLTQKTAGRTPDPHLSVRKIILQIKSNIVCYLIMHIWFSFYLSAIGIQCIFLTHQQGAYETRVGVSDWITGGEVQVGNTGWVTFRWSLLQLPPVGEPFTWLNLISFPLYTYNILFNYFLQYVSFSGTKQTFWLTH